MIPSPWAYRARCSRVVDGDTIDVVVDVGFQIQMHQRLRLLGVNTPELHAADLKIREHAVAAKHFVESWVRIVQPDGMEWPLMVVTSKDDAFGRWLADVWAVATPEAPNLNAALIDAGHAVEFRR